MERLRSKRADERVSFGDVADHLEDYVRRQPEARETIDGLARFLAGVEGVEHEHDGPPPTVDASTPVG